MSIYIENFDNNADIIAKYDIPADTLDGAIVHLAWYGYGDYSGKSLVVLERDGKLYEVNASHCSCYGLEEQWYEEETSWEALEMRNFNDYEGGGEATRELAALVAEHLGK
jgi:hypothetical protein